MSSDFIVFLIVIAIFGLLIGCLYVYLTVGFPKILNEKTISNFPAISIKRRLSTPAKPGKYGKNKSSSSGLEYFMVLGNRAKFIDLAAKDKVLVRKFKGQENDNIPKHYYPRIVIKKGHRLITSSYRICRFIDYADFIDLADWEELYQKNSKILKEFYSDASYFAVKCRELVRKEKLNPNQQYAILLEGSYFNGLPQIKLYKIKNLYGLIIHKINELEDF